MPRKSAFIQDNPQEVKEQHLSIEEKRQEAIDGVFQIMQFGCIAFGNFADAGAIGLHGPPFGNEIVSLAGQNKFVASKVDLLIEAGPYAGIIAAGLPFVIQILANHGLLKASQWANAGVVPKEQLELQMQSTIMQQQMAARQMQRDMEKEMSRLRDEMVDSPNGESAVYAERDQANVE